MKSGESSALLLNRQQQIIYENIIHLLRLYSEANGVIYNLLILH